MSTVEEIKKAIARLPAPEREKLRAWISATGSAGRGSHLDQALHRGLEAAREGRVRSVDEVRAMVPKWVAR